MKKVLIDCFIATLFVFVVLLGIREISQLKIFNVFDPLGQSLGDMEITDITFSQLRLKAPPPDANIVIVNIGNLSRAEIAEQIRVISQLKPKVIGIDAFFDCRRCFGGPVTPACCPLAYDTLSNLILGNAISDAGNVVLVTKLVQSDSLLLATGGNSALYDSLRRTSPEIRNNAYEGFASLETDAEHQEDLKICRRFNPMMKMANGDTTYAFSTMVAKLFDPEKAKKLLERQKEFEVINFRGNTVDVYGASHPNFAGRYTYLEHNQATDTNTFDTKMIKDKIVLFGFMGENIDDTSWDDKFITPLNKKFAGKTRPDMYGIVLHANIISMILSEDYINELAFWQQASIAFFICFLNVMLFYYITIKIPDWFDGLSLLIQLIQILMISFLMMWVLMWANFKLDLTLTLASLALVGTCFELYVNVVKRLYLAVRNRKWLTKRDKDVLTK